jgi:hypothetical protein
MREQESATGKRGGTWRGREGEGEPDDDRLESGDGGGLEPLGDEDLSEGIKSLLLLGGRKREKLWEEEERQQRSDEGEEGRGTRATSSKTHLQLSAAIEKQKESQQVRECGRHVAWGQVYLERGFGLRVGSHGGGEEGGRELEDKKRNARARSCRL